MVCTRLVIKSPAQVSEYIANNVYARLTQLVGMDSDVLQTSIQAVVPPSTHALKTLLNIFKKGNPKYKPVLLLMIQGYRHSQMEISGIFQSACILSIAGTGLAAFLWWFKASRKLDLPPGELVDFFSSARFTTFLQMIYTFEALTLKPKITDTWMFSRLLRDDAWANFTIPRVPFPVAICVAVTVDGDRSGAI
uniref:Uncharacterized protein n=2 Tax=Lutzomyia longipalpis TaxID=7200 RepID=A0A1B0C8U4_LUTLO